MQGLMLTTCQGQQIRVSYNPITRHWERIYPESELMPGENPITLYWANGLGRYVSIPN